MRCAIRYHLYNLKNVKKTHEEVLVLVKLQKACQKACNFSESNTAPRMLFTFFKIVQMIPNCTTQHIFSFKRKTLEKLHENLRYSNNFASNITRVNELMS